MGNFSYLADQYGFDEPFVAFELSQTGKNNSIFGLRCGAVEYIVKQYSSLVYDNPDSLTYENRVLKYLSEANLSFDVPLPLLNRDGSYVTVLDNQNIALVPRFKGEQLNTRNLNHIEDMGRIMGELQTKLAKYPADVRPGKSPFIQFFDFPRAHYDPITLSHNQFGLSSANNYIENLFAWWRDEARELSAFVDGDFQKLPKHICHNDITAGNVLVEDNQVSAVLDFEFLTVSPRAFDLAMGLRMTMRVWENPQPWRAIQCYFAGYGKHITLSSTEIEALPLLLRLRSSMSILWWLGQNQNHKQIPELLGYQRNLANWLTKNQTKFLDVLASANDA